MPIPTSTLARDALWQLMQERRPEVRRALWLQAGPRDRQALKDLSLKELGSEYGMWRDDPLGFHRCVLGQGTWSKQRAVLQSTARHQLTAVPSAFSTGKTLTAASVVCHHVSTRPAGTALAITTATRFRQVKRQMWPEIRRLASIAGLPGQIDTTQWKMPTTRGVEIQVAYGFTAPPNDEAAGQGIHATGGVLLIVDEAGGLTKPVGRSLSGATANDNDKLLAIGNPATDDEGTWFEDLCENPDVNVISIPVTSSPAWTGERTGRCGICPRTIAPHQIGSHLVSRQLERRTARDYGTDSPYYQAKVMARFPKGGANRALPSAWVEAAQDLAVIGNGLPQISRDLLGNFYPWQPGPGAWIRLGVDVAADGGDELAIARAEGDVVRLRKHRAGPENHNSVNVAGFIIEEIREAMLLRKALGTAPLVRVKVDAIGVGWGVCGILEDAVTRGLIEAEIVRVVVSENPHPRHAGDDATMRPDRKRDEMWLAMRALIQPDQDDDGIDGKHYEGAPAIALDIDDTTRAQLAAPKYETNSSTGKTKIESKKSLKGRGLRSPDRGEAVLLAVYEPLPIRTRSRIIAGA